MERSREARGWHSRGYLPHFDGEGTTQFVTYHLADSLPSKVVEQWIEEFRYLRDAEKQRELGKRIEKYLDAGYGARYLQQPKIAELVQNAFMHFDGDRYRLYGWVVMPNHIHVLFTPGSGHSLGQIIHSWKSFTATKANKLLGRTGDFWFTEYYDRYIRDERHFHDASHYVHMNPVRAGLCVAPEDWEWSSASTSLR